MSGKVSSVEQYVEAICRMERDSDECLLYRGHCNGRAFTLKPSIFRKQAIADSEHTCLRDLIALHPEEFAADCTTLERLVRAQHYSLPTRLLDVTWNPLVALYFAAQHKGKHTKARKDVTGEVIVIRVKKHQIRFYDSDTVSCIANLAHLRPEEKRAINFGFAGKAFNKQPPIDRLLQFIRMEKPYFRPRILPEHLNAVLLVKPKQNNRRILAQAGAFLLYGCDVDLEAQPSSGIRIRRVGISKRSKEEILDDLDKMGVNEKTMFPEIEKAAKYIVAGL